MPSKFPIIDLAIIREGKLVIFRNGEPVADFDRDEFPALILKLATELRYPTK